MHRTSLTTLALSTVILAAQTCSAAISLSLSSPDDLNSVMLGQTVTVNVGLSGLAAGDELDFLAATIGYNPARFGVPSISPGAILPNPLDNPLDFVTFAGPGIADGSFLTFGVTSADRITGNGVFFSFAVMATSPGAGSFEFTFTDAQQFNPADPSNPIFPPIEVGAPLGSRTLQGDTSGVPEPASVLAWGAALALGLMWRSTRRSIGARQGGRRS